MGYDNFRIMNDFIINSWNKVVSSEDKIILMGDIGNATFEQLKGVISQLNGDICYTATTIDKFTKKEWEEIGIKYAWNVSLFKELENNEMILYCITPIRRIDIYEQHYKLIVVDKTNPIDGMVKGKMLSADAAKWGYSPIDTDNLIEIYNNMKEFEEMKNEEHRSDIQEG